MTGATGCLGLNLSQFLIQKGYDVLALGRDVTKGRLLEKMGAKFTVTDIRSSIIPPENSYDFVIHCAALSSPWGRYQDFYDANVSGTKNVLNLAKKVDADFIHISTPSIYFDFKSQLDITEDSALPKKFASNYTRTKKEAEELVIEAHHTGMKTVILRPRGIFGKYDQGIMPRILKIAKLGFFPLINNGRSLIDLTYVENVSHAINLCLGKIDDINGEVFNITNGEPFYVDSILKLLFNSIKMKVNLINVPQWGLENLASLSESLSKMTRYVFEPPLTHYTLGLISYSQTLNIKKAAEKIGYKPIIAVEQGIQNFAKWYNYNEN